MLKILAGNSNTIFKGELGRVTSAIIVLSLSRGGVPAVRFRTVQSKERKRKTQEIIIPGWSRGVHTVVKKRSLRKIMNGGFVLVGVGIRGLHE